MPVRAGDERLAAIAAEEQAFARAVEHQHFGLGIDRRGRAITRVRATPRRRGGTRSVPLFGG